MSDDNYNGRLVPGIKPPQLFSLGTNVLEKWKISKHRWQTYVVLSKLEFQSKEVQ
ncbi:hypothetical protein SK128_007391, partial [Halocaridina rubra]